MNSIGVNGPSSTTAALTASAPGVSTRDGRSPSARLPTWSWFWEQTTKRRRSRPAGTGAPQFLPRKVDQPPSCTKTSVSALASVSGVPKST